VNIPSERLRACATLDCDRRGHFYFPGLYPDRPTRCALRGWRVHPRAIATVARLFDRHESPEGIRAKIGFIGVALALLIFAFALAVTRPPSAPSEDTCVGLSGLRNC
jgi:hypothetical protein